jgi:hypothetical protein
LNFCRNEKIAFSDTDKMMYNLETTKDRHFVLSNFLKTQVHIFKDDIKSLNTDMIPHSPKFCILNQAFNMDGTINRDLDTD